MEATALIEALEHRWMRAWAGSDRRAMKALTARRFRLVVGSKPPAMLDLRSWLEAAGSRYRCRSYRFGTPYVRVHGAAAIFASELYLEARMDGNDWSGSYWLTDLWTRSPIRRRWQLTERILSRPEEDPEVPAAIRLLQLWR